MTSQASDVEILVHVTAPSRVADDATYRRLAQAYLAFQPTSRSNITIPCSQDQAQPGGTAARHQRQHQWDKEDAITESFGYDSQDISFDSVLDNRSSPLLRAKTTHQQPATPSPTARRAASQTQHQLPSQIADSYPMPGTDVFNVTPTRVLQRYLGNRARASSSPSSTRGELTPRPVREINITSSLPTSSDIANHQPSSQENVRNRVGTTIPVTPVAPTSAAKRKAAPEDEDYDITHISSSALSNPSTTSLVRAESDPLPSKRHKPQASSPILSLPRSSSDSCAKPPTPTTNPNLAQPPTSQLLPQLTSLEIRPPSPEPTTDSLSPTSLISSKLAKLAQDLSSRYRPQAHPPPPRALHPLERGYWLVDSSAWTPETRIDTWTFLTNYIRSGLAGWGVWCRRSEDWAQMRLYGWAHVAKHTYLLLYLASGRVVKMTGARWVDAEGEAVIVVAPN